MIKFLIFLWVYLFLNHLTNKKISEDVFYFRELMVLIAAFLLFMHAYSLLSSSIPHSNKDEFIEFLMILLSMIVILIYIFYKYKTYGSLFWVVLFDLFCAYVVSNFLYNEIHFKTLGMFCFFLLAYLVYTFAVINILFAFQDSDDSFILSFIISALTGSILFGYLIGENFFGAFFGSWFSHSSKAVHQMPASNSNITDFSVYNDNDNDIGSKTYYDDDSNDDFSLFIRASKGFFSGSGGGFFDDDDDMFGGNDFFSSGSFDD